MESLKKLETMEEELKLIKGELKESLSSVRDYLLNMELPTSEFANVLAALGNGDGQTIKMEGNLSNDKPSANQPEGEPIIEETEEEFLEPEPEMSTEDEEFIGPEDSLEDLADDSSEDPLSGENPKPDYELPEDEYEEPDDQQPMKPRMHPEEEPYMSPGIQNAEAIQSTPKVNLLANLMHWVTKTKKTIGCEQMPTFLEVYGISGHLSPELKEVILHMVDISSGQSDSDSTAEIWSQSMLSLHGILTGGDGPLYPMKPLWNEDKNENEAVVEEITEVVRDEPKDQPLKLKLMFPGADGKNQEFCLDLKPERVTGIPQEASNNQEYPNERGEEVWQKPKRKKK